MLPGHVIDVAVGVICQTAIVRRLVAKGAQATVLEILCGKALEALVGKGDTDNGIAIVSKLAGSIERQSLRPIDAREADARGVDDRRRKDVDPVEAAKLRRECASV